MIEHTHKWFGMASVPAFGDSNGYHAGVPAWRKCLICNLLEDGKGPKDA